MCELVEAEALCHIVDQTRIHPTLDSNPIEVTLTGRPDGYPRRHTLPLSSISCGSEGGSRGPDRCPSTLYLTS